MNTKQTATQLQVGAEYSINGATLKYRWSKFSVAARQTVHFFSNGYFSHTLRESELDSFLMGQQ